MDEPPNPDGVHDPFYLRPDPADQQPAVQIVHAPLRPHQKRDAGAVHKRHAAQIQHQPPGQRRVHRQLQLPDGGPCRVVIQLAGELQQQIAVNTLRSDIHLQFSFVPAGPRRSVGPSGADGLSETAAGDCPLSPGARFAAGAVCAGAPPVFARSYHERRFLFCRNGIWLP